MLESKHSAVADAFGIPGFKAPEPPKESWWRRMLGSRHDDNAWRLAVEDYLTACRQRDARLREAATAMADRPTASNPQRLDWNEQRAFYRLVNHERATPENLQSGHRERTRTRMAATPNRVLVIHDTTELDFTGHQSSDLRVFIEGSKVVIGSTQLNSPSE